LWYNSAFYQEPDAPHDTIQDASGLSWYAMSPRAETPQFESVSPDSASGLGETPRGGAYTDSDSGAASSDGLSEAAMDYSRSEFRQFMPGFTQETSKIDASRHGDGMIEARHADGSATAFYDKTMYGPPRGDYQVFEDRKGGQWYAIQGTPVAQRRPVYEDGKPVYDGGSLRTVNTESVRYKTTLTKFEEPEARDTNDRKPPNPKRR
jgi:hypothetical protein